MDLNKYINDNLDELMEDPEGFIEKSLSLGGTNLNPENEDTCEDDLLDDLHQKFYENKTYKSNIIIDNNNINNHNEKKNIFGQNQVTFSQNQVTFSQNQVTFGQNQVKEFISHDTEDSESEESLEPDEEVQDFTDRFKEYNKIDEESDEESNKESDKNNLDIINDFCVQSEDDGMSFYFGLMNVFMKHYNNKFEKHDNFFTGIKDSLKDTSNPMELFFESIIEFKQLKTSIIKDIEDEEIKDNDESVNNLTLKFYFNYEDKQKIAGLFDMWEGQIYCLEFINQKIIFPSLIVCLNYIVVNNLTNKDWTIFNLRDN